MNMSNMERKRRPLSRRTGPPKDLNAQLGINTVGFRILRVSSAAGNRGIHNLVQYSRQTYWESYARQKETVIIEL